MCPSFGGPDGRDRPHRRGFLGNPRRSKARWGGLGTGGAVRAKHAMATPPTICPTLQIINGPMSGQLFTLDRDVTVIGRNPECDIVLQPKSVSRKHAAIVRKDRGFVVKDMGSTRGTFVNGQRL